MFELLQERSVIKIEIKQNEAATFWTASTRKTPILAPPAGLEPATPGLTVRCSNQLSYGGVSLTLKNCTANIINHSVIFQIFL